MRLRSAVLAALTFALGCGSDNGGVVNLLVVAMVEVTPGTSEVTAGTSGQLAATPKTSTGLAIPGRAVTWSSSDQTVATVSAGGLVQGVAVGGPVHIRATVDGVTGEALVTVVAVPVDHVTVMPGDTPLLVGGSVQLTATAFDAAGAPLAGRSFLWQSSAPAVADVTSAGLVLALAPGGPVTVTASSQGKSGTATVTVFPRPASRLGFVQQPGSSVAGQPITPAVRVAVQDDLLATVTGATNSVTIALAANPGGATLGGTATVNAVAGIATFSNLTLDKTGTGYTLLATSSGLISATSNPFNVTAGAANRLSLTTQPSATAQSGVVFSSQPVAQVLDLGGNPVLQAGIQITAAISSGPAGASLGGTLTVASNASGAAVFGNLSITGGPGTYSLMFSSPGLAGVTSSSIMIGGGTPTQLAVAIQPSSSAPSGAVFAQQPAVQLLDASNNTVAQAGVVVTATIASGGGTLGGTVTATTNTSGLAVFTNLSISGSPGPRTLSFSASGLTGTTSNSIDITAAGTATQLSITTQPSATAQSGVPFAQQPVIQLRDAGGGAVSQAGVNVTVTIASGGGTLGGTTTVATNASGVATFTNLSITGLPGDRTLGFAATGLTGVTSGVVTVSAGSAGQLGITTQPSATAQSGVAFIQQPVIQLRDALNNPVAQAGVSITAAINSGGGTLGGTTTVTTDANGTATFTNLSISGTIGQRTLLFAAVGYVSVASSPIDITAGPADHLTITVQPSANAQSGVAFPQQPVIQLRDASGNAVSQAGVVVTASIASGGGTLGGTSTASTNASGVASFTNLSISGTTGNYTLGFAAPSLTGVTSATIALTVVPTTLTITTQPSATAQSGVPFTQQPVLLLQDSGNNPAPGFSVTATISSGPAGATLVGTATVTTDALGHATFSGLGLSGTVGSYSLTFTAGSVTSAASNTITLAAGPAASVAANSTTSQSATVGTAVTAPPSVRITDAQGNPVASFSVGFAVTAGGGSVAPATVSSTAAGVASASNWILGPTAGTNNNTVQATASGLTGSPVIFTASGTAGPAAQLTYVTQPSTSAQSGVAFAQQPVLLLGDASNNPVAGTVVTATVSSAGASLFGATTATTDAAGHATFTDLGLTGATGNYTLTFTAGAVTSPASNVIALSAPATNLSITTQPPSNAMDNVQLSPQPVIQLRDAANNPVGPAGIIITAALVPDVLCLATLTGGKTATTGASGEASFASLKINITAPSSCKLRFTAPGLTGIDSNPILVSF
jgi:hypothetical protein